MTDFLPARPDRWIFLLAEGWSLACLDYQLPVADFIEWNAGWPVVLLQRTVE